jgi:predicted GIY-YIG superfamily endonuclease
VNGSERHPHLADAPHFLYRLLAANGDLLYLGCSADPERRLAEHRRKPWGGEIAAWQFAEFRDARSAYAAERDAIASESPRYNAMHNGAGLTGWNEQRRFAETCLNGHYWDENAKTNAQGARICATCERIATWRHDAKRGRPYAIRKLAELDLSPTRDDEPVAS